MPKYATMLARDAMHQKQFERQSTQPVASAALVSFGRSPARRSARMPACGLYRCHASTAARRRFDYAHSRVASIRASGSHTGPLTRQAASSVRSKGDSMLSIAGPSTEVM